MNRTNSLPSLETSYATLDLQRETFQAKPAIDKPVAIPRRIIQYWDRNTPDQIRRMLDHNREVAKKTGVDYVFFDEISARIFLEERDSLDIVLAYDAAVHPAMKCDLFRLCYLHAEGGFYVDADLALKRSLVGLFELPGGLVAFQWDKKKLRNLCNWLIGAAPGNSALRIAIDETAKSIAFHCQKDPQSALKSILAVSGPGIFTKSIAMALEAGQSKSNGLDSVNIESVSTAHRYIMVGPQFLKAPLHYKSDGRNWTAGEIGGGDIAAVRQGWVGRMASAITRIKLW